MYPFTRDGKWTGKTYGGTGSTHGKFHTCHAMTWDPRGGQMAVSDRANHRIEYFKIGARKTLSIVPVLCGGGSSV